MKADYGRARGRVPLAPAGRPAKLCSGAIGRAGVDRNETLSVEGDNTMAKKGPRKKAPKTLAVINADNCTGCESCIEVCPVDCIELIERNLGVKGSQAWCQIDLERCVGCEVCVHIPQKKSNPYALTVCPWDAIELVPTEQVASVVAQIGGPTDYLDEHWQRLVDSAQSLAELRAGV